MEYQCEEIGKGESLGILAVAHLHFNCMFGLVEMKGLALLIIAQPVHFLANSVIGPSFYIEMPTDVIYSYDGSPKAEHSDYSYQYMSPYDSACVGHIIYLKPVGIGSMIIFTAKHPRLFQLQSRKGFRTNNE